MHVHFSIMSLWLWQGHIANENADFPGTCQSVSQRSCGFISEMCVVSSGDSWRCPCDHTWHSHNVPQSLLTWACNLQSHLRAGPPNSLDCRLKLNVQKTKVMASGPITSWEIDGETVEAVSEFILGGSKITADGDCSHEIKRCLLLGRKVMTNLDSMLKSKEKKKAKTLLCQQRSV